MHPLLRRARAWIREATTLDVTRFTAATHPLARRKRLFEDHGVDVLFDIGANVGQYATEMRELGYAGWIISYEPLASAYRVLAPLATGDARWKAVQAGLAAVAGRATLNVAANSQSSSLLPMLDAHLQAAPESAFVGTEEIEVVTLADALAAHASLGTRPFVKIDAQGAERAILESGPLTGVAGIQLEMSLVPLYAGETVMTEMIAYLDRAGFQPMSLEPGYTDPRTGRLLQVDGVFFRTER